MMDFTNDEMNLMCIYSAGGSRTGLMKKLSEMKTYLDEEEGELFALTESVLAKLSGISDKEFDALELIPDFDV